MTLDPSADATMRGSDLARILLSVAAMTNELTELERELDVTDPLPIARLSPGEVAALTEAVRDARARHAVELQQSIDAALEQIPRVLRGALRKVLF